MSVRRPTRLLVLRRRRCAGLIGPRRQRRARSRRPAVRDV